MILWLCGSSGAGKTTLGLELTKCPKSVLLDADFMRQYWSELGWSQYDREASCWKLAKKAKEMEHSGLAVVVSAIAPYEKLRKNLREAYDIVFIQVDHTDSEGRKDDAEFENLNGLHFSITV